MHIDSFVLVCAFLDSPSSQGVVDHDALEHGLIDVAKLSCHAVAKTLVLGIVGV